jgi:aspartate ammonia-lyase
MTSGVGIDHVKIEIDFLGYKEVPREVYYGIQTLRVLGPLFLKDGSNKLFCNIKSVVSIVSELIL